MDKEQQESFRKYLIGKLDEIHESKKGKIEPNYVLLTELSLAVSKDIKTTLNTLYFDKDIRVGETLNDKYIIRKSWENE